MFEVSSPGLGRPLKKEKDFARSLGEEVEIRTYRAIDRQKEFDRDSERVMMKTLLPLPMKMTGNRHLTEVKSR